MLNVLDLKSTNKEQILTDNSAPYLSWRGLGRCGGVGAPGVPTVDDSRPVCHGTRAVGLAHSAHLGRMRVEGLMAGHDLAQIRTDI